MTRTPCPRCRKSWHSGEQRSRRLCSSRWGTSSHRRRRVHYRYKPGRRRMQGRRCRCTARGRRSHRRQFRTRYRYFHRCHCTHWDCRGRRECSSRCSIPALRTLLGSPHRRHRHKHLPRSRRKRCHQFRISDSTDPLTRRTCPHRSSHRGTMCRRKHSRFRHSADRDRMPGLLHIDTGLRRNRWRARGRMTHSRRRLRRRRAAWTRCGRLRSRCSSPWCRSRRCIGTPRRCNGARPCKGGHHRTGSFRSCRCRLERDRKGCRSRQAVRSSRRLVAIHRRPVDRCNLCKAHRQPVRPRRSANNHWR